MPNPHLRAAKLTRSPRFLLRISLLFLLLSMLATLGLLSVPWRQAVLAQGQVSVFNPMERPQPVDAQIKGRLKELKVVEGQDVKKGQLLAVLEDRDSKFLDPSQQARWQAQLSALYDKESATVEQLSALQGQSEALSQATRAALASAQAKIAQSTQKLALLKQQLRVGKQDVLTARLQRERIDTLFSEGLRSQRDQELAIQKQVETETYLQKMEGEIALGETDISLARLERAKIEADQAEKRQKIAETSAKAQSDLAETREKIEKLKSEASVLDVRRSLQKVYAPLDGRVVKLGKIGPGHMIKEGDTLALLVPANQKLGVELYLRGLDTPLVQPGQPVRLMFEGFPAVPFTGWPWAAVGTFGGRVTVVDPVASGTDAADGGKSGFRVWVEPDPTQPAWPASAHLRIDSKATGWIMLDDVPLYYEIWRQLNAFPPRPALDETSKAKTKPVIRR